MQIKFTSQADSSSVLSGIPSWALAPLAWLSVARFVPDSRGNGASAAPAAQSPAQMRPSRDPLAGLVRPRVAEAGTFDLNRALQAATLAARSLVAPGIEISGAYGNVHALHCDGTRMQQALFNLILDAAHAIDGPGTVEVGTSTCAGMVRVAIRSVGGCAVARSHASVDARLGRALGDAATSACGGWVEAARDADGGEVLLVFVPAA